MFHLEAKGGVARRSTYGELELRARAVAGRLRTHVGRGDRVLLLYPSGLDFVEALFGCFYNGAIAIPALLPHPLLWKRSIPRLQALCRDAIPRVGLTVSWAAPLLRELFLLAPELEGILWIFTDEIENRASGWFDPRVRGDDDAVLQYTSGALKDPKGVILTHQNILHNARQIRLLSGHCHETRVVSWLPHSHDMGLFGGLLQPLCAGGRGYLISTIDFLKDPGLWPRVISRYRGTSSPAPNFAYDLCARKVLPEEVKSLDLRCWEMAYNGAETVRPETMERFVRRFGPAGFRKEAFYPCYGLAEATLMVSGGRKLLRRTFLSVDRNALEGGRIVVTGKGARTARLSNCGGSLPGQRLVIVDPDTSRPSGPDRVGEIWVAGPSVAKGYWNRPIESRRTFRARLFGEEGYFLRTGDLGFMRDDELFVTGRMSDSIIVHGNNHQSADIERTVEGSHASIRPNGCAVFMVEEQSREVLVLGIELEKSVRLYRPGKESVVLAGVRRAARKSVWLGHFIHVDRVVLLRQGTLRKTTSGKVRRGACRSDYLSGGWTSLEVSTVSRRPKKRC